MAGDTSQQRSKRASDRMEAPACVHVYVWAFMVVFSLGPALCVAWIRANSDPAHTLEGSLTIAGLIQAALLISQCRCASKNLSYWDGLLVAAASVTTGENLISLLRAVLLLFAVAIASIVFAMDHDDRLADRHAGLRFGNLIICLHEQRLRRNRQQPR